MEYFEHVGAALRKMIRAHGSQAELAKAAGLRQAQVSEYLTGKTAPSLHNLGRILDALDASLVDLWKELLVVDEGLRKRFPEQELITRGQAAEELVSAMSDALRKRAGK